VNPTRLLIFITAASIVACSSTPAPETPAPQDAAATEPAATSASISAADLEHYLTAFAHDSMMGRETGTAGNMLATDYIAAEVARMGLEPAGDDGTYFQILPLVERRPDGEITIAGAALEIGVDFVPVPRLGSFLPFGMKGTLNGTEVIYGGPGSDGPALSAEQVAGKLVVLDVPLTSSGQPNIQALNSRTLRTYSSAAGVAIAALEVLPPRWAQYMMEPRTAMSGGDTPDGPLGLFITRDVAAQLVGVPLDEAEVGTSGITVESTLRFAEEPARYPARNVVAIVRGSDPQLQNEYVSIGSHNDHVGFGRAMDHDSLWAFNHVVRPMGAESPNRGPTPEEAQLIATLLATLRLERLARLDSVYNGADDDGSGSVAMLEIAEMFANSAQRPRRSIVFVWHTGEEVGLYGASWFTRNPTVPREDIVANFNMDMVGRGGADDIENGGPNYLQLIGSRRLSTELGDLVEEVNVRDGFGFEFDYQYDADGHPQNYYCRSDHYMYARYGIPIVFLSTGSHQDYHQLTDEAQYIDYEKLAKVSEFVYALALTVADMDHRPVVDKAVPGPDVPCRQ
jgi:hypothetical protein